jgi:similar to stage IV sporulation protein
MNDRVLINVKGYIKRFIDKGIKYNINFYHIDYLSDNEINVLINFKDYKLLKRVNYYSKIKLVKFEGLNGLKRHIKSYLFSYLLLLFSFILMDVITSYIVDINIIHENKEIRNLVQKELGNHGILKYHVGFSFEELQKIKNQILDDNPTSLEWMSITRKGMTYVVRVEERIIKVPPKEEGFRHIVSNSDALITKVISNKGEVLVRSGDYVKKKDILISGQIKLYDEIKGNTLADGYVFGDVWYNATIKIPLKEDIKHYTGESRVNININNKILLKNKYANFVQDNIRELKILGLKIKIYKEKEYKITKKVYSIKELDKIALEETKKAFIRRLGKNGTIKRENILKKEQNNSTIEYRIFVVTNELLNDYLYYSVGEENDTQSSN